MRSLFDVALFLLLSLSHVKSSRYFCICQMMILTGKWPVSPELQQQMQAVHGAAPSPKLDEAPIKRVGGKISLSLQHLNYLRDNYMILLGMPEHMRNEQEKLGVLVCHEMIKKGAWPSPDQLKATLPPAGFDRGAAPETALAFQQVRLIDGAHRILGSKAAPAEKSDAHPEDGAARPGRSTT